MTQPRESGSDAINVGRVEVTDEFVLSAQDLLEMSRSGAAHGPTADATPSNAASSPAEAPVSSQAQSSRRQQIPSWGGRLSARRVALSLSILTAVVATGVVLYLNTRPASVARSSGGTEIQAAASIASSSPAESEPVPVRFVNPFDRTEVFEFPAGTSDVEARDAVADILIQRAQERRHQRNPRSAGNAGTERRVAGIAPAGF